MIWTPERRITTGCLSRRRTPNHDGPTRRPHGRAASKTWEHRYVDIPDNLLKWLHVHGVNRCGRICPGDFAQKHRANYKRAGLTEWKQDVMRHTFASNHLAHFGNLDALLQAMGYRSSPQTLWRYYHKARTKSIDEVITRILGGQNAVNTIRTSIRGNYCSDRTITPFVTRKPVKTQDADPLESTQAPFFKL